jgi:hypothetical protein
LSLSAVEKSLRYLKPPNMFSSKMHIKRYNETEGERAFTWYFIKIEGGGWAEGPDKLEKKQAWTIGLPPLA